MKIDFTSDLHLDFWLNNSNSVEDEVEKFCKQVILAEGGEVLIIAGDLGHYFHQNSIFLRYVKTIYKCVILVHGNHDLYLVSNKQGIKYDWNSWNRIKEMKEFCAAEEIHYLDGDTIDIDGILIGGLGMSWDSSFIKKQFTTVLSTPEIISIWREKLNDDRFISRGCDYGTSMYGQGFERIRVNPTKMFSDELIKLQKIEKSDIIVTHYGPVIPNNIPFKYLMQPETTCFFFDGKTEIERLNPMIWIFGHTHNSYSFMHKNTQMLCSPLGYPGDNNLGSIRTIEI